MDNYHKLNGINERDLNSYQLNKTKEFFKNQSDKIITMVSFKRPKQHFPANKAKRLYLFNKSQEAYIANNPNMPLD